MLIFNHPLKNVLSTVVGVTALFTSVGTFAASVSTPQTATATLVFTDPVVFTHTLTPKEGLVAGVQNGALATGKVTFSAGATEKVAYTFGEGTLAYPNVNGAIETTVPGTNNPNNKLRVLLSVSDSDTTIGWGRHEPDSLIPYVYATAPVSNNTSSYELTTPSLADIAATKPDSYVVSVTAYGYRS